jgi:hypothetical protein
MKEEFEEGQNVKCLHVEPLLGNDIAPPLKSGEIYRVKKIVLDKQGNQHLDVGLVSKYKYISSFDTGEHLPDGDKIHWCHPSRFETH